MKILRMISNFLRINKCYNNNIFIFNISYFIFILYKMHYYNIFNIIIFIIRIQIKIIMGIGDWGLGIGDWGLGPIPNPQSPIPNKNK